MIAGSSSRISFSSRWILAAPVRLWRGEKLHNPLWQMTLTVGDNFRLNGSFKILNMMTNKKNSQFLATILLLVFSINSFSQETNNTDNVGRKQGLWLNYKSDTICKAQLITTSKTDTLYNFPEFQTYKKLKAYYEITQELNSKGKYIDNKCVEIWTYYYNSPNIDLSKTKVEVVLYKGDSAIFEILRKTEIIKSEINYINGKIDGTYKMYYKNGKIKSEISFHDNYPNDSIKTYFENGKIMYSGKLMPNDKYFQLTEFYETGSIKGDKKMSIDYILQNFTNLSEIKK